MPKFDPTTEDYNPDFAGEFDPVPSGSYLVRLAKAEAKLNRKGDNYFINCMFVILDDGKTPKQCVGRKIFDNMGLNFDNGFVKNRFMHICKMSGINKAFDLPGVNESETFNTRAVREVAKVFGGRVLRVEVTVEDKKFGEKRKENEKINAVTADGYSKASDEDKKRAEQQHAEEQAAGGYGGSGGGSNEDPDDIPFM